jgi:uncharacterized protein
MDDKPVLVLDTNVTLDWLVFADPRVGPLARAVLQGQVVWLACPAMRHELACMVSHPRLAHWRRDATAVLGAFDALTRRCPDPPQAAQGALRCTDTDDQVFVDLALHQRATALLSFDRAVLKLARAAARRQLLIARGDVAPALWGGFRPAPYD